MKTSDFRDVLEKTSDPVLIFVDGGIVANVIGLNEKQCRVIDLDDLLGGTCPVCGKQDLIASCDDCSIDWPNYIIGENKETDQRILAIVKDQISRSP